MVSVTKMEKSTSRNLKKSDIDLYKCEHCGKNFKTENGLIKHLCKTKKRWLEKDELYFQKGFIIFQKFNEIVLRARKEKTRDEFISSSYYDGFINLSKFLLSSPVAFTEKYYLYLFKNNIKMNIWDQYETYRKFLLDFYKTDDPTKALERTLGFIGKWAENKEVPWTSFFKDVSPGLAIDWIKYGRISPWILYCNQGSFGISLFERISDEQLNMIAIIIDPVIWNRRLAVDEKKIMDFVEVLKEYGM